jgi:biopolymer transport protein ExbB
MQQETAQAAESAAQFKSSGFDVPTIIENAGHFVYLALAILGTWALYNTIVVYRSMAKKRLPKKESEALMGQVRDLVQARQYDRAIELCMNPTHWHSALAQMIAVGLKARPKGLAKVKQALVMDFHTEVVSPLERRMMSLGTASRLGPLVGLLGTVMSMIAAFAKMGGGAKPDPLELASAISLGLWATAAGLLIATPMMAVVNDVQGKLRKLRDTVEHQLQEFVEMLEQADPAARQPRAAARAANR